MWNIVFLLAGIFASNTNIYPNTQPRSETPNPQFVRREWISLNGEWDFSYGDNYEKRKVGELSKAAFNRKIIVPFAPETVASGIGNAEFDPNNDVVWYRRSVIIPQNWQGLALLHFGAVDYECEVFVNGKLVGLHKGGYAPFSIDLSSFHIDQEFELIVRAHDPSADFRIARGKQETRRMEGGIFYDKSTGIRETVWIERVAGNYIKDFQLETSASGQLQVSLAVNSKSASNLSLRANLSLEGQDIVDQTFFADSDGSFKFILNVPNVKPWSPESPHLYNIEFQLFDEDRIEDIVQSYTGFKSIEQRDGLVFLNGKPLIQRLILDQGYYPDTGYTPGSIDDMRIDIEMAKKAGFNGARFHQQVACPYKRYLADKLGFLYWVEIPSARNLVDPFGIAKNNFTKEAIEIVKSARNSVGLIAITGFNETWGLWEMSPAQKAVEQIDLGNALLPFMPKQALYSPNDGWEQITGIDSFGMEIPALAALRPRLILALHDYPEFSDGLFSQYNSVGRSLRPGNSVPRNFGEGQATLAINYGFDSEAASFLSEFGGVTTFFEQGDIPPELFGYHRVERNPESALRRIGDQIEALSSMTFFGGGFCYTQLRDTGSERNGILFKDGSPKFSLDRLKQRFFSYQHVVATSEFKSQNWTYTFDDPKTDDWINQQYDDTAWSSAGGGFGERSTPGAIVRTDWNTERIWLRRTVDLSQFSDQDLDKVVLRLHYDEDAKVFINGLPASINSGFLTGYRDFILPKEVIESIKLAKKATLAIHARNTTGGQYIDAGLVVKRGIDEAGGQGLFLEESSCQNSLRK